jgi:hypothetical protein
MASQTPIGSTKIPLALPFGTLQIGNAAGTLYTPITTLTEYRMPRHGWVIGLSTNLTGTLLTGTLSFYPTLNGSPMTNSFSNGTVNIGTFGNYERDQAQQPGFQFSDSDTIGVGFSKTGTVTPTTRDLNALLLVLLDGYDY